MRSIRCLVFIAAVLSLAVSSPAQAQTARRVLLEGSVSYVSLSGAYADLVKSGWAVGGLVGIAVTPHIWLMGNYNYSWHGGDSAPDTATSLPNWTNISYFGMVGYDPVPPNMNGDMILFVGAGGVVFDPEPEEISSETYFAVNGGVKLVFHFGPHAAGTINLAAAVAFSDGDLVGGTTWFFPVGLGLGLRF